MKREPFGDVGRGYYALLQTERGRAALVVWISLAGAILCAVLGLWAAFFSAAHSDKQGGRFIFLTLAWLLVTYLAERRRRKLS